MTNRGFALLAVLWLLTALMVLGGVAVAVARTGSETTRNRILLTRAGWAREACMEILLARSAHDPSVRVLDSIDLGRGTWCRATVEDPAANLNVNLADRSALVAVIGAVTHRAPAVVDSLVDALLDWRDPDTIPRPFGIETAADRNGPLADVAELRYVRGFDDSLVARLAAVLTIRGTGSINLGAAPPVVIATVPGMSEEAIALLVDRRLAGHPVQSADELAGLLSSSGRATLYASYPEFVRAASFAPAQLIAIVEGGVRGTPLVARVTLTTVPVAGRLAVIRRETE
jgi:type II secretory pathway component PulK